MNRKKLIIGAVVICCAIAAGVSILFFRGSKKTGENESVVYVNSVESLMNPGASAGRVNRFAGVVETQKQLDIRPEQDRTIKEVLVKEGDRVTQGTVLFTYDTEKEADSLSKLALEMERIDNTIQNKQAEIAALEKEKKQADSSAQLDYTMQIQGAQMELKQSEYEKKTKEAERDRIQEAVGNSEVLSQMDGIVKSVQDGSSVNTSGEGETAFMTIIAMGDYRIKGRVNEQNIGDIMPGQEVLIHSRADDDVVWQGIMGEVDREKPSGGNENAYGGDTSLQSSSYPFYVELKSSQGLMLGQHVYIEPDFGQEKVREGVWLDEAFIVQDEKPFVWTADKKGRLEKREVVLGSYDEELFRYEIKEGLLENDMVTFPEEGLKEGMETVAGANMGEES